MRRQCHRMVVGACLTVVLVGGSLVGIASASPPVPPVPPAPPVSAVPAAPARRPNIILILTDDLDVSEVRFMPNTLRLIGGEGATFDNYFVSNSLCCPSRTTTLRGQYAHNTGVLSNGGGNGGFAAAFRAGIEHDTYATRLQRSGYRTGLFGKYLNGYPDRADLTYVPPGWSVWASASAGLPYSEYDYTLNENGKQIRYGAHASDYGTNVYFDLATRFAQRAMKDNRPFFAAINVYAPHLPATPARQDKHRFSRAIAPRTPSFDLRDTTGKPSFIRALPRFTPEEIAAIDRLYRLRLRSIQAVDRNVARLVATLQRDGELANTYIVFASDNGYHLGQFRLPAGKETAYDTDIRVPLMVRGPGIKPGEHIERLALNTDLAPTFEAMANVRPAPFTDGRSELAPLLGSAGKRTPERHAILIEHWLETPNSEPLVPIRGVEEPRDADQFNSDAPITGPRPLREIEKLERHLIVPAYTAVRTSRYLYVEYGNGERELYDLKADPYELHNLSGTRYRALERVLAQRLAELRTCRAGTCRHAENEPVRTEPPTQP